MMKAQGLDGKTSKMVKLFFLSHLNLNLWLLYLWLNLSLVVVCERVL